MRIQILELPTQHLGEVMESPYVLVLSEVPEQMRPREGMLIEKKSFDGCAGVIVTTDSVQVGPESAHEMEQREAREEQRRIDAIEAQYKLPFGSVVRPPAPNTARNRADALKKLVENGILSWETPSEFVECPERATSRGCACALGAEDCPVNGKTPATIGMMDVPPEGRAVSVTENTDGTRIAHVAIDGEQTPEELAGDVAAIVEERRGEYRQIGFCSCQADGDYEPTCGIPAHRDLATGGVIEYDLGVDAQSGALR